MNALDILPAGYLVLIVAYLLGSIPTALLVSRRVAGVDIREIGDGNMGARNVTRTLGWGAGAFVGSVDFSKGAAAVLIARYYGLDPGWQLAAGICAVLGHDFPIWAGFRGGQGMAAILGTLFVLSPWPTVWGLAVFGSSYLIFRNFDLSAGLGLGSLAFLVWRDREPSIYQIYTVLLFLSIPAKKVLDWPRRRRLEKKRSALESAQLSSSLEGPEWVEEAPAADEGTNGV